MLVFNQRSVQEILDVIVTLGNLVGKTAAAQNLAQECLDKIAAVRAQAAAFGRRPRVYFEEWFDPPCAGIRWVSELIDIAGGDDVFAERARAPGAKERKVDLHEIEAAKPDIILASWCGEPFDVDKASRRLGKTPAAKNHQMFEVPPEIILQPGPAALLDGLDFIHTKFATWARAA